ncbi:aminotransferase class V-fold PLP-dependent enzyme [bacterium]|nr:aminotransferase class V-fold PLP-dependent enzyme [bacterium]
MIYLDNAATSFPKPESVYVAMDTFARTSIANPGRSGHRMALASERILDDTRHLLNRLFRGESPDRWIFTLNCTDALNMAIKGLVNPGDHVITSDLEHNSVSRPLRALEKAGVITLTRVASNDGYLDPAEVTAAITPKTRLVAITHAANVLGTLQPIEPIAAAVRAAGAFILIDAAQSAGVVDIDLARTPIDMLAFPGHKALFGPTGTGALYVGPRVTLRPWREGGTGGDSSTEVQPDALPFKMEGGTPNVAGIAGLKAGLEWVLERGVEPGRLHEVNLLQKVVDWVAAHADHWGILGAWDPDRHVGALSLRTPEGLAPSDIGAMLDTSFAVAIRPGLHCAPYIHKRMGTFPDGSLRLSPGPFNTEADIEVFLQALGAITEGML